MENREHGLARDRDPLFLSLPLPLFLFIHLFFPFALGIFAPHRRVRITRWFSPTLRIDFVRVLAVFAGLSAVTHLFSPSNAPVILPLVASCSFFDALSRLFMEAKEQCQWCRSRLARNRISFTATENLVINDVTAVRWFVMVNFFYLLN